MGDVNERAPSFAAGQVNATLTLRNWYISRMIDVAVLHEDLPGTTRNSLPRWGNS